jgi:cytochrome c-type biogenesis protein CcmH/NrfG
MNDIPGAERAIRKSIELAPRVAEYHYSLGMLELHRSDFARAAEAFRTATQLQPESGPAWFGLGESLEGLKDAQGAGEAYRKTIECLPDHEQAQQRLRALESQSSQDSPDDSP